MLACTHGSNRAAALNRHPRSSRLRPVSARRRGNRWRSGRVCAVCGFWLPAATRLAVPAYCRIWRGLEQGTPLSGRSIPCSRHHLPFQSAAKARRRLHKFSIRFASQSYQGSSLEGQLQVLLPRAGLGILQRSDGPARIAGKRAGQAPRCVGVEDHGTLGFCSPFTGVQGESRWGRGEAEPARQSWCCVGLAPCAWLCVAAARNVAVSQQGEIADYSF